MACKYCSQYIARAFKEVERFEDACRALRLDPKKSTDYEAIVRGLTGIGQFGRDSGDRTTAPRTICRHVRRTDERPAEVRSEARRS